MSESQPASRHARLENQFTRLLKRGLPSLESGPGWDPLLMDLLEGIDKELSDPLANCFCVQQIKEKFGALRFYWHFARPASGEREVAAPEDDMLAVAERLDALVDLATARSKRTCMACGGPGPLRAGGWVRVSCAACEKDWRGSLKRLNQQ